MNKKIRKKKKR